MREPPTVSPHSNQEPALGGNALERDRNAPRQAFPARVLRNAPPAGHPFVHECPSTDEGPTAELCSAPDRPLFERDLEVTPLDGHGRDERRQRSSSSLAARTQGLSPSFSRSPKTRSPTREREGARMGQCSEMSPEHIALALHACCLPGPRVRAWAGILFELGNRRGYARVICSRRRANRRGTAARA